MGRLLTAIVIALAALGTPARAERMPSAASTRVVFEALSMAPAANRPAWRWRLARDYAARGLYAEADGVLRVIAADTPRRAEAADFRVLHSYVLVTLGRAEDALPLLDSPLVARSPTTCRIRMNAAAQLGNNVEIISNYNCLSTHRTSDTLAALRASVALGDLAAAGQRLGELEKPSSRVRGEVDYWRGRIALARGQRALALEHFRKATESPPSVAALRARIAATELSVAMGAARPTAALAELNTLRHVRRGGAAERDLLLATARLADKQGDIHAAFSDYVIVAKYGDDAALRQRLTARFARLFADGGTALPPAKAFALFWDFRELAPQGPAADEMVRRLADRLAGLGLNAQAASLLEHQVFNRLEGTARSIVASRLAALLNTSGYPARALQVLASTAAESMPDEVLRERRLLEAEALIGVGRVQEAKTLLAEQSGPRAATLRAEAAWAARDWGAVIALLEPGLAADGSSIRDVLRVTVAAAMDGDDVLLRELRQRYGSVMAKTAAGRAFDALTGDPAALSPDQLRAALAAAAERAAAPNPGRPV